jgi:uncharacterized membrane protein
MKRLCRWLFNLVAWTSFLLFVFTIAAWVFSYWRIYQRVKAIGLILSGIRDLPR